MSVVSRVAVTCSHEDAEVTVQVPIFVINLDRRPDRLHSIAGELGRLGLEATRVPAIDALSVADDELNRRVNFCGGLRLRSLQRAEAACTLSHLRAMETFLSNSDAPAALILEDDTELANDLPLFVENVEWWPKHAALVKLETQDWKEFREFGPECAPRHHGRQLRRILLWTPAAGGYMLGRQAASFILSSCRVIADAADRILFDLRTSKSARELRPVQVLPGLVRQRLTEFESDLEHIRKDSSRIKGMRRFRRHLTVMPREAMVRGQLLFGYARRMPMDFADRCRAV